MAGEWTDVRLDDLVLKRNQGVNTTTEKVNYAPSGVVVIRANNVSAGRIDFTNVTFVDSETFGRINGPCKPKQGDVLYTNIGSQFGNAAIVKYGDPFVIAWNVLRLQPNKRSLLWCGHLSRAVAIAATRDSSAPSKRDSTL